MVVETRAQKQARLERERRNLHRHSDRQARFAEERAMATGQEDDVLNTSWTGDSNQTSPKQNDQIIWLLGEVDHLKRRLDEAERTARNAQAAADTCLDALQSIDAQIVRKDALIGKLVNELAKQQDAVDKLMRGGGKAGVTTSDSAPRMRPKTYDGTEDLESYLQTFEEMARLQGWTEDTKSVLLRNCVQGKAATIISSSEGRTFQDCVDALRAGLKETADQCASQLSAYKQGATESLGDMAVAIARLGAQAYGTADSTAKRQATKDAFVRAIADVNIRNKVRDFGPETMRQALDCAKRYELNREVAQAEAAAAKPKERAARKVEAAGENKEGELARQVKQLAKDLQTLKGRNEKEEKGPKGKSQSQTFTNFNRGRGRGGPWQGGSRGRGQSSAGNRPQGGNFRFHCFGCGRDGHTIKFCREQNPAYRQQVTPQVTPQFTTYTAAPVIPFYPGQGTVQPQQMSFGGIQQGNSTGQGSQAPGSMPKQN